MPLNIKFFLVSENCNPFHCAQHISAIFWDPASDNADAIYINYPQSLDGEVVNRFDPPMLPKTSYKSVTLHVPDKDITVSTLQAKYKSLQEARGNYDCICDNCVDNAYKVMDFLFGKGAGESNWYKMAQCITFCCLCGLGCSCCPGPCGVSVPYDGFKRALRLSNQYGLDAKKGSNFVEVLADITPRSPVAADRKDNPPLLDIHLQSDTSMFAKKPSSSPGPNVEDDKLKQPKVQGLMNPPGKV